MYTSWNGHQYTSYNTSIKSFKSATFSSWSCFLGSRLHVVKDSFLNLLDVNLLRGYISIVKMVTSVWKNKKELKVFHLSDFYQSITCMMMWDHWNYCYFISQKMHIDLNKYDFEQKNEFNVIHIHHLSITNLEWHCKNGLNTSQNRL